MHYLNTCALHLVTIPYSIVPHTGQTYLQQHSKLKLAKKFLHRYLWLKLSGQLAREIKHIRKDMRVLWLYTGKPNIGDALMDMSGRALLRDAGITIDLLTLPNLYSLFCEDDIFSNVYSNLDEIKNLHYDAVLLNEFNYPSLRLKTTYFKNLPFACLFQYFHGPDRNQTLFSFAAINDIFGLGLSDLTLQQQAKPYLHCQATTAATVQAITPTQPFITLAVGGIDPRRTYPHWLQMLMCIDQQLSDTDPRVFVLLGSNNGLRIAETIAQHPFKNIQIVSLVNKLSLLQASAMIEQSKLFVGCDGGLMHIAHSTPTPSVRLFAAAESPELRLTQSCHSISLHSKHFVDALDTQNIIQAIKQQLLPQKQTASDMLPKN